MSDLSDSGRHIAGDGTSSRASVFYVDIDNQMESQKGKQQKKVKQKCQWWGVYVLGLLVVIIAEVLILLTSYYTWVLWPALSFAIILVILGALAVVRQYCPGRQKPYSTLVVGLFVAALVAVVGGVMGAYYFKYVWFFDKGNKYSIDSDVNPSTFTSPTFLSFSPGSQASLKVSVALTKDSTTYCLAPIVGRSPSSKEAFYWAVDTNCCSGGFSSPIINTCRYFGERPADEVLSGEVYADPVPSVYREATDIALQYYGFQTANSALFISLVSEYEHDLLMRLHRTQAYMCVTVVAFAWPILGLFYELFEWAYNRKRVV